MLCARSSLFIGSLSRQAASQSVSPSQTESCLVPFPWPKQGDALCAAHSALSLSVSSLIAIAVFVILCMEFMTQKLRFCMLICVRVRACVRRAEGAQFELENPSQDPTITRFQCFWGYPPCRGGQWEL